MLQRRERLTFPKVDNFIMSTRRKGGRQTEKSVLSLWKVSDALVPYVPTLTRLFYLQCWLPNAIKSHLVPDVTIDANHIIEYLKYAATRNLLAPNGQEQQDGQRLSPVSLS
jgi:hypothetical protein